MSFRSKNGLKKIFEKCSRIPNLLKTCQGFRGNLTNSFILLIKGKGPRFFSFLGLYCNFLFQKLWSFFLDRTLYTFCTQLVNSSKIIFDFIVISGRFLYFSLSSWISLLKSLLKVFMIKIFKSKLWKSNSIKKFKNSLFLWSERPKSLKRVRKTNRAICEIYEASVIGVRIWVIFFVWKKIVSFLWLKWGVGGRNFLNKASLLAERECPTFSVLTPPWTGRPLWVRLINFRPTREINQNPDKWNRPTFDLKFYNFPKTTVMNRN